MPKPFELPPDPFDEMNEASTALTGQVEQLNQMLVLQSQQLQQFAMQMQSLQQLVHSTETAMRQGFAELSEIAAAPAAAEYGPDGRVVGAHKVLGGVN